MQVSKVVSIEITDTVTRVCEMAYGKKNPMIFKSVIFENPEYTVDDGFVGDKTKYASEFRSQMEQAGIKCKDAVFTLSSSRIVSREVTIPEMKEELIPDLIEGERENYFPMDTTGYSLTFHVIEKLKEEKQLRIIVYAAQDLLIKNYNALASELDLKIVALDYNGNSIYQWLKKTTHTPIPMYLQINEKNAMFTILENNLFSLQRNMNFGSRVLTANLIDEGYFGDKPDVDTATLKLCENELLYKSLSEADNFVPTTEEENNLHQLKRRLTDATRPLIANVSRVLEYYNTKNREAQVTTIYLGGIGARIKGLKELIESEFNGIEVVIIDKLPGLNISKTNIICAERSSEFIACIGAAEKSISFYQVDEKEQMNKSLRFCIIALAIVFIASAFIVVNGYLEYNTEQDKEAQYKDRQATLEASGILEIEEEYNYVTGVLSEIDGFHESTHTPNEEWNDVMDYLESESISDIVVSSISSDSYGVTMTIVVDSKEQAAKLLLQLKGIPYFDDVQTNSITETIDEETNIKKVSFSVLCTYKAMNANTETTEVTGE